MTWETAVRRCDSLHQNSELASIRDTAEFNVVAGINSQFLFNHG